MVSLLIKSNVKGQYTRAGTLSVSVTKMKCTHGETFRNPCGVPMNNQHDNIPSTTKIWVKYDNGWRSHADC